MGGAVEGGAGDCTVATATVAMDAAVESASERYLGLSDAEKKAVGVLRDLLPMDARLARKRKATTKAEPVAAASRTGSTAMRRKSNCHYCEPLGRNCGLVAGKCPNRPCSTCGGRHRLGRCRKKDSPRNAEAAKAAAVKSKGVAASRKPQLKVETNAEPEPEPHQRAAKALQDVAAAASANGGLLSATSLLNNLSSIGAFAATGAGAEAGPQTVMIGGQAVSLPVLMATSSIFGSLQGCTTPVNMQYDKQFDSNGVLNISPRKNTAESLAPADVASDDATDAADATTEKGFSSGPFKPVNKLIEAAAQAAADRAVTVQQQQQGSRKRKRLTIDTSAQPAHDATISPTNSVGSRSVPYSPAASPPPSCKGSRQYTMLRKRSACHFCSEIGLNCGLVAGKCPNRPCSTCNGRHRHGRCRLKRVSVFSEQKAAQES